ncbi:RHS repeat-associated core domain-containing protein [Labilibaculum sp. K2S]|uniref:RHS repeat domain-containing protein n=1 Tax=Labilibaculum sp. K2S TaxID=3056386 RepID=UPI0025A4AB31|nr:RHS repeat-associated core domain-containing protein [Labilibaculum sp. K2S]MDM8160143.1 RHS repeat-associated core domain-containing protein [Labilibaculum sp. K2S]
MHGNQIEDFGFDALNRLTTLSKGADVTYTGDNTGNLLTKSDVGSYEYKHSVKKHAVTSIQNPSSSYQPSVESVTYTAFNKVNDIEQTLNGIAKKIEFSYGAGHARKLSRLYESGAKKETNYYTGSNYEVNKKQSSGVEKHCHYISAPSGLAAVFISSGSTTGELYFIHTDYLGSVVGLSNQSGYIAEEYAYDAWGNRGSPGNWALTDNRTDFLINRGYTMHEHMNGFGLINMSRPKGEHEQELRVTLGRVYDPKVGRFLSPDPVLQDAGNTQNMNRYSYCLNNPLKYTDPSGYISVAAAKSVDSPFVNANWYGDGSGGYGGGGGGFSSSGFGGINGPGVGENGLGLNGVYYDWNSGTYRSTSSGNQEIGWGYVNANVSSYGERYVSKDAYTSVGAQRYYKGSSLHLVREPIGVVFMSKNASLNESWSDSFDFNRIGYVPLDEKVGFQMANYRMTFNAKIIDDYSIKGHQRVLTLNAISRNSLVDGDVFSSANVTLIINGNVISSDNLRKSGLNFSSLGYLGSVSYNLPNSGEIQVGLQGGWVVSSPGGRSVPVYHPIGYPVPININTIITIP